MAIVCAYTPARKQWGARNVHYSITTNAKLRESVWILTTDGITEVCTCPMFLKKGACKHSLGVKVILGQVEVPPHATSVPLGQKKKCSRPKKVGATLMRD